LVVRAAQGGERIAEWHARQSHGDRLLRDVGTIAQHASLVRGRAHAPSPGIIELAQTRDERVAAEMFEPARDEGLDGDVVEITPEANHSREDERLPRDVDSGEISSRIWFGVPRVDRVAQRLREAAPSSELAEHKAQRTRRAAFDTEYAIARVDELVERVDHRETSADGGFVRDAPPARVRDGVQPVERGLAARQRQLVGEDEIEALLNS